MKNLTVAGMPFKPTKPESTKVGVEAIKKKAINEGSDITELLIKVIQICFNIGVPKENLIEILTEEMKKEENSFILAEYSSADVEAYIIELMNKIYDTGNSDQVKTQSTF